jgi:hypothetical protein
MRTLQAAVTAAVLVALGAGRAAWAAETHDGPCGLPPEAKPQRIKGGEGVPPLPLPATPLRRSERKREPAPPTLVGKIVWGEAHSKDLADGRKAIWYDWNTDPSDMQRLLRYANDKLGVRYRHVNVDLKTFSWDPTEVPVLYIQGRRAVRFDDDTRKRLRDFLTHGGFLWADACQGAPAFADAIREEMRLVFPTRPLVTLAPDHPVFRCTHRLEKVKYSPGANRPDGIPILEGLDIGCRTAVFLTPYDLSCAWDSFHVPEGGRCVVGDDALQVGINMVAYSIAYYNLGRFLAQRRTIATDDPGLLGDFIFAQVKTNGDWDPDPSAFATLLKTTLAATNTKVRFGRKDVPLTDPDLTNYPFLYLTGHRDFAFSDAEVAAIRGFLANGGFLFADACCGSLAFDLAFRREMKRVLPDHALKELPHAHPVFSTFYDIARVTYTPQVRISFKEMDAPYLEGIAAGNETRVIYSRFDLGCGWEGEEHPYAYGVATPDAVRLGINIIMYAMTH